MAINVRNYGWKYRCPGNYRNPWGFNAGLLPPTYYHSCFLKHRDSRNRGTSNLKREITTCRLLGCVQWLDIALISVIRNFREEGENRDSGKEDACHRMLSQDSSISSNSSSSSSSSSSNSSSTSSGSRRERSKSHNREEEPVQTRVYIPCIAQGKAVRQREQSRPDSVLPEQVENLSGVRDAEQTIP
ncbi:hypothetical protein HZH66_002104 [Vespula vulgaris]|uniref:Uncharacterized protein n=1 Tax=Vespula vulgaris TaxID=7454 RepID=A0A834NFN0_VESVU|nr:hypothetical protein HZH66_002104 [Vespula vulgaris]